MAESRTITANGVTDPMLYQLLSDMIDLVNELRTDAATNKTIIDELKTNMNGINAKLDADAGVTDTDYAATWDVASSSAAATSSAAASFTVSV